MNLRVRGDEGVAGAIGNVGQLAGNPLMGPSVSESLVEDQVDNLFSPVKTRKM
jgi:hypothetical protein